jgi:hypothetical protein
MQFLLCVLVNVFILISSGNTPRGAYLGKVHIRRKDRPFKGIVQRKLRWVKSGVNRRVMLQYWGAGHYVLILKEHYLVFRIKRFAAT